MLNNLIKKLDKTGSTKRTLASSRLHPLRIREKTKIVFCLRNRSTSGWETVFGHYGLGKTL